MNDVQSIAKGAVSCAIIACNYFSPFLQELQPIACNYCTWNRRLMVTNSALK